jgi:MoxR-like ATPase
MEFYIYETKRTVKAKVRPIVIITSNAEKELPDAFLRRCIFHYIDFPEPELMEEIVKVHLPNVDENVLKNAFEVFYDIRAMRDVRKKPSTSELIDWINVLQIGGIPADEIRQKLPFVGVIVKKDEDLTTVRQKINL